MLFTVFVLDIGRNEQVDERNKDTGGEGFRG